VYLHCIGFDIINFKGVRKMATVTPWVR